MSTKVKFDPNSVKFRLWISFLAIGIGIILLIWMLQIFFLNNYYEHMKTMEVNQVASSIHRSYVHKDKGLTESIQELSISNDFYVMMESSGKILLFMPESESILPVYKYRDQIPRLKSLLKQCTDPDGSVSFKLSTGLEKYNTLAYASYLDNTEGEEVLLYIFSPLYPVTSTVEILKDQLFYVTIIALIATFILALCFSNRISRPLKSMTTSAKKLGKGNYKVKFESDSYSELNNLARTLNIAAYEMGQADNRQKDLIANVSHDLKTPLTMIRSYAEMIRDLSGDNPEKRNAHLQVIIDEANRMSRLVGDMATITAMQTKKMVLHKEASDLSAMTASILASYEILQEQEGYDFKFNAPKECFVYADADKIKQVIANLTGNAVKYCGEDKVIEVSIRRIGKVFRLEVSDHGPGIKPEELPHVWDRYYKTSTNYVRETSGTGLGLSIVKEILTLHGANYGVESKVGKGSTFWFELEMYRKEKAKAGSRNIQKTGTGRNKKAIGMIPAADTVEEDGDE